MKVFQSVYKQGDWSNVLQLSDEVQLLLLFGSRLLIADKSIRQQINKAYPNAAIVGCTTSGEILGATIYDDSLCLTAIAFDSVHVSVCSQSIQEFSNASELGKNLVKDLSVEGLQHVLVFSDGQLVNGSELVDGIANELPQDVVVTGGLAGDGSYFEETIVWHDDKVKPGLVALVGLYGGSLQIGHGQLSGWKEFGPLREITRSHENILYELDGKPALELYKDFLGQHAQNLPASGLLFPLAMRKKNERESVIRTILNIDEEHQSLIFAGNMPEGADCQLMRANYENLVDGAHGAATNALAHVNAFEPDLALLISCVGRRLVLSQRVEEELEIVQESLPEHCAITGFYSYGEISPVGPMGRCSLHNQTMTITLFSEMLT